MDEYSAEANAGNAPPADERASAAPAENRWLAEDLRASLALAIHCRSVHEVRTLVLRGAPLLGNFQLEHPDEKGNGLDLALYYQRPDVAFELLRVCTPKRDEELVRCSRRALVWAARDGRLDLMGELLKRRPQLLQRDWHGRTPLHVACLRGHENCALELLREGAWDIEPDQDSVRKWASHWQFGTDFEVFRHYEPQPGSALARELQAQEITAASEAAARAALRTPYNDSTPPKDASFSGRKLQDTLSGWKSNRTCEKLQGIEAGSPNIDWHEPNRPVASPAREPWQRWLEKPPVAEDAPSVEAIQPTPQRVVHDQVELLHMHEELRDNLMAAIRDDNPVLIEELVQRGAPLLNHYHSTRLDHPDGNYPESGLSTGTWTSKGAKTGLVNPVDWAVLEHQFRAAMQLLLIGDDKVVFERDEHRSFLTKLELARQTIRAVNLAAFRGQVDLLKMLLDRGADVGQTNSKGESALNLAVREDKAEAANMLLQYGAWAVEDRKREVLERALMRRMKCVLDAGGISAPDDEISAAHGIMAAEKPPAWEDMVQEFATQKLEDDKPFCIERIMERSTSRERSRKGWASAASDRSAVTSPTRSLPSRGGPSPLSTTAVSELGGEMSLPVASVLTGTHGELRSECRMLNADLTFAIQKGDEAMIRSLVTAGAPLEGSFDLGYGTFGNCIDWACVSKQPAMALVLLELADTKWLGLGNELAVGATSALFWSVLEGFLEVLKQLLARGASASQRSRLWSNDDSALALAISSWRDLEAAELLRHGAWEAEPESRRPELLRLAQTRKPIAEALRKAGIDPSAPLESKAGSPAPLYMHNDTMR
mmetsp:Transcript_125547/g.242020  ORF Transcript_125547/g.242020 Transcript_125547/m.242020 type:complete len:828 (-) Transcript_125547:63-2546(-)